MLPQFIFAEAIAAADAQSRRFSAPWFTLLPPRCQRRRQPLVFSQTLIFFAAAIIFIAIDAIDYAIFAAMPLFFAHYLFSLIIDIDFSQIKPPHY
jgi:hypothetical protein